MIKNNSALLSRRSLIVSFGALGVSACAPRIEQIKIPSTVDSLNSSLNPLQSFRGQMILTYDDGPHVLLTPQLLDILGDVQAKAIFFMVGQRAKMHPEIVRRVADEGHIIGNHSWSHPDITRLSPAVRFFEIDSTQKLIEDLTGVSPVFFRPPYGSITPAISLELKNSFNLFTVMWDVDTLDYTRPGVDVVASRVMSAGSGKIVLMHDIHASTIEASRKFLRELTVI
jgi:peptidoglycan/xylan/chitin deacetylase (PgdA/CDA1 family)